MAPVKPITPWPGAAQTDGHLFEGEAARQQRKTRNMPATNMGKLSRSPWAGSWGDPQRGRQHAQRCPMRHAGAAEFVETDPASTALPSPPAAPKKAQARGRGAPAKPP